jgi:hypothetical protein
MVFHWDGMAEADAWSLGERWRRGGDTGRCALLLRREGCLVVRFGRIRHRDASLVGRVAGPMLPGTRAAASNLVGINLACALQLAGKHLVSQVHATRHDDNSTHVIIVIHRPKCAVRHCGDATRHHVPCGTVWRAVWMVTHARVGLVAVIPPDKQAVYLVRIAGRLHALDKGLPGQILFVEGS